MRPNRTISPRLKWTRIAVPPTRSSLESATDHTFTTMCHYFAAVRIYRISTTKCAGKDSLGAFIVPSRRRRPLFVLLWRICFRHVYVFLQSTRMEKDTVVCAHSGYAGVDNQGNRTGGFHCSQGLANGLSGLTASSPSPCVRTPVL